MLITTLMHCLTNFCNKIVSRKTASAPEYFSRNFPKERCFYVFHYKYAALYREIRKS